MFFQDNDFVELYFPSYEKFMFGFLSHCSPVCYAVATFTEDGVPRGVLCTEVTFVEELRRDTPLTRRIAAQCSDYFNAPTGFTSLNHALEIAANECVMVEVFMESDSAYLGRVLGIDEYSCHMRLYDPISHADIGECIIRRENVIAVRFKEQKITS